MTGDHDFHDSESSWVAAVLFIIQDVLVLTEPKITHTCLQGCLSWTVAWQAYP